MSKQAKASVMGRITRGGQIRLHSGTGLVLVVGYAQVKRLERAGYVYDNGRWNARTK